MICISRRVLRSSRWDNANKFLPRKLISPLVGSIKRRIVRPNVDLPHPDSPTKPRVSPSLIDRLTPSTALTAPLPRENNPSPTGKCFFKLRISNKLIGTIPYREAQFTELG